MAEAIVFGMAGNILSDLSSHAVQQIASVIGVQKDLSKLKDTLSTIDAVLKDADEQQLIDNHELKDWVKKIKNVCYEAEDVLDDFGVEALRQKLRIRDNTFKKVRSFAYSVSFRFKMSRRIKAITQSLDEIAANRNKFHITKKPVVDASTRNRSREQTHAFVEESEVFGRDGDKNKIINMLSGGDEGSVVAIVGMAGLGKTTLAQMVYNDKVVDNNFEMKMWAGVYQDFDVKKILGNVIKSATNNECPNLEMDQLRTRFQELVKGKKFLLVLDDVWNEDAEKWDKLKFLISSGASGSRVVITTRDVKVATIMAAKQYRLKELSSDDCWNVFRKRVFSMGEEQANPNLVAIGKQMADRCRGVPLAAKTLGSLMCLKTTQREWEIVRDSDVWRLPHNENDIMPALRLSYNHLPIYLKQCFAYLAVIKMGSPISKNSLIHSWIAHGFVRLSPGDRSSLEDVGNEYVKELLWRSLIQEQEKDICGNLIFFKVHDLVHNLATYVLGTEFIFVEKSIKVLKPEEIRYAFLDRMCSDSKVKEVLSSMPNLRELGLFLAFPAADIFSRLKRLRCLKISLSTNGLFLSSIGILKHLRELTIFSDEIQTLPTSVTKLINLQTLSLFSCPKLRELPEEMGKMVNLRHVLLAEGSPISHMPLGFKNLTSLRTLTVFFVGNGVGCKLNELQRLVHLEGDLVIKNLENVCDARDCAEVNLKEKKGLEKLKFSWNNQNCDEDVSKERSVDVLENMQPHSDLKILDIEGYMGCRFSSWVMKPNITPKLLAVSLVKCKNSRNVPPFGELPLLTHLLLKDMDSVVSIDGRGENGPREWFPSLKTLVLENLPNLESFGSKENSGTVSSLPSLVELTIIRCSRLGNLPKLPSLERLEVNCSGEKLLQSLLMLPGENASTSSLTRLKYMQINGCDDLISLPKNWSRVLVSLEKLVIKDCSSLNSLEDESNVPESTCLLTLGISKLPKLMYLPGWFQNLTKLQNLWIDCEDLVEVPDWFWELTSLRGLSIVNCRNLKSLPDGMQSLTALEILVIKDCASLMSWPNGFGSLVSLKQLSIGCSPSLPSLPEELQQLTALRVLSIGKCETMLGLPEWLLNFTSLQSFAIYGCKNLQGIPDWFPELTTLTELYIHGCDELTSRCEKGTGADWPNIAHIPNIALNGKWIQGQA